MRTAAWLVHQRTEDGGRHALSHHLATHRFRWNKRAEEGSGDAAAVAVLAMLDVGFLPHTRLRGAAEGCVL